MSGIDLLSLPPNAPSPLNGSEEVPVYVADTVQTTTTSAIAAIPEPVYTIMGGAGMTYTPPPVGGTIVVDKTIGSPTAITLPAVPTGTAYCIKDAKGDAVTNPITITPAVGTIDNGFNYLINWNQGAVNIQFDGSDWNALSNMGSGGGGGVTAFNGRSGSVVMVAQDIVNAGGATTTYVDNSVAGYLPLTGGAISGNLSVAGGLTAPTMPPGTNTTNVATTAFVEAAVVASTTGVAFFNGRTGNVVLTTGDITGAGGATAAQLSGYLPLAGGAITGPVTAPTPASTDNSTAIATTAFVRNAALGIAANYLPLAGGTLTGNTYLSYAQPYLVLNKTNPAMTNYIVGQNNGVQRWNIALGDGVAESGSNSGSNFEINSYTDSGTFIGAALSINRSNSNATFSATVNAAGFQGNTFNSNGNNSGYFMGPRSGSGDTYGIYSPDGGALHIWDSSVGDVATINGTTAMFWGQVMACSYGGAGQLRMLTGPNASGYGAMWRNDGSNTYFLLTNQNDAMGQWNGLRPITINNGNGAVSVANGFTANNITTQYGVIYSALAGNTVAFRWTGVLQIFIDGNYNGDIATTSTLGNYLPISGGTVTGQLTVNGLSTFNGVLNYGENKCYGYLCRAGWNGGWSPGGNHFNFNWASAMAGYVDNTSLGNIMFSSDYRIKRNIASLGSTWDRVKALRPISYNLRDYSPAGHQQLDNKPLFAADTTEHWGFLAHELQDTLIQDAATGFKDDPNSIQSPNPWVMLAAVTKALQEAMARIEALEARLPA